MAGVSFRRSGLGEEGHNRTYMHTCCHFYCNEYLHFSLKLVFRSVSHIYYTFILSHILLDVRCR